MLEPYQGPGLRPLLWLLGHVRPVGRVHPRARQSGNGNGGGRAQGTRADISIYGQESNYTTWRMAKHEPRHPRDRGPDRARRQLPQRSPPGPSRPTTSSPIRHSTSRDWGRRAADATTRRWQSTASRPWATRTSPGYSTILHHLAPARLRPASCWPTARCRRASRAREQIRKKHRSRPTSWTASSRCQASSSARPRSRHACGSCPARAGGRRVPASRQRRDAVHRRPQAMGRMVDRTAPRPDRR